MIDDELPRDRALTREELRAWLDRKPDSGCMSDRGENDSRDWYEFEIARDGREQAEAGHA